MPDLPLPERLRRLISRGVWPSEAGPSMTAQQLRPLVAPKRVQRFADDESLICLQPPPFHTVADYRDAGGSGDFWEKFGALDQIVPDLALVIGDFGLGSDSVVVLDYARHSTNPPVLRLRWGQEGRNQWVQGARDFDEFAEMLGLDDDVA